MALFVDARHPVPARIVPPHRRRETWGLLRHATPIAVREVPDRAPVRIDHAFTREGHALPRVATARPSQAPLHQAWLLEGRIWTPIGYGYGPDQRVIPWDAGTFAAWLASDTVDPTESATGLGILAGTPLYSSNPRGLCGRGRPPDHPVRLLEWYPDRAATDLKAFCRDNLVIAGDTPFLRLDAPLSGVVTTSRDAYACIEPINPFASWSLAARPDRVEALSRSMRLKVGGPAHAAYRGLDRLRPDLGLDLTAMGDVDLLRFANAIPREMAYLGGNLAYRARMRDAPVPASFLAMEAWDRRSDLGGIARDEIETLCRAVLACVEDGAGLMPNKAQTAWLRRVERYVRGFMLPLLGERETPADDVDALGALAS